MKKRSALVVVSLAMAGPLVATQHDQSVLNPIGAYTPESLACLSPMETAGPGAAEAGRTPSPVTPEPAQTVAGEPAMAAVAEDGGVDHIRSAPPPNPYVGDDSSWQPGPVVATPWHGTSASYAGAYGYNNASGYASAYRHGGWQPAAGYGATYRGAYYNNAVQQPASVVPVRSSDVGQTRAVATAPRLQAGTFGISVPWGGTTERNGSTYDGMPGMRMGSFEFPGFGRGADRSSDRHDTAAVLEMGPFSLPARRWAGDGWGSNAEGGQGFHFGPFSFLNGVEDSGNYACTSGLRSRYGASRACGTGLYAGRDFITDYLAAQTAGVIAGLDYPARFAADGIGGSAGSAKVVGKRLEEMEDRLNLILVLLQRLGVSGS